MMIMKLFSNSAIVVMVVLQVVNVVHAQSCSELSKKKCKASTECGYFDDGEDDDECISTNIGKFSIVRDGKKNFAPGKLCTVGGGEDNLAGTVKDEVSMCVVGGGKGNFVKGDTNVVSGGKGNYMLKDLEGSTISGGYENQIGSGASFSVITGGLDNYVEPAFQNSARSGTISGGIGNTVLATGGVVTGGESNGGISEGGTNAVITGGFGNDAKGLGGVVMGGRMGNANGKFSFAYGNNTYAQNDHSMVIALTDTKPDEEPYGTKPLLSDEDGQFLVYAEQFTFQIGNNVDTRLNINKDNMKNLLDVLNED